MLCSMAVVISLSCLFPGNVLAETDTSFHRFWPDNLFAVEFVDDNTGFIAGYSGSFLRTTDAGKSWSFYYIGENELIRRISFVDADNGWAVGHRGAIFHTEDGGKTWVVQHRVKNTYMRDIDFADANNGWAVGHDANIWHTSDAGKTWQQQELLGFLGRDIPRLHGIFAKDKNTAILVGEFGVIAHTENGGQTWLLTPTESSITYLAVAGNDELAYVVGLDGTVVRLSIATEAQWSAMRKRVAEKAVKTKAKAIAKAKRKKRKYIEKAIVSLPQSDIEYFLNPVSSNTSEHLFDVDVAKNGDALIVGRSTVIKISDSDTVALEPENAFPLPFVWLGGVSILPDGTFWASGIRGVIAKGNLNTMQFSQAAHLAASKNIKLVTSRWGNENE